MSLATLAWAFTAAVLLHNGEEALWLPRWSRLPGRWIRPVGDGEFRFAAVAISLLFVALTFAATAWAATSVFVRYLFAGYVVALLANAVVPHLAVTVGRRQYMPGTATAWLLVAPLGCLYLRGAVGANVVELSTLLWVGPLVALCLLAAIPPLFALGRRLAPGSAESVRGLRG